MRIAVAAPNGRCTDAALAVAGAGGGAVDAAIAAMVTAMATEPGIVSPLGGGFVTVWPEGGEPEVIDGNVEMPGRGLPAERFGRGLRTVTSDYGGGVTLYAGPGSAATPGALAAFGEAHRRHGRAPWSQLFAPAAAACEQGYPLGRTSAAYLQFVGRDLFGWDPQSAALVLDPSGAPLPAGTVLHDPALAQSLRVIGRHGADEAYTGALGRQIAADVQARGGLITEEDLAAYQPVVRRALGYELGDWLLATNPPPSIGGPLLVVMLGELASRVEYAAHAVADLIDIQRHVLTYRQQVHDHSADLEEDGHTLLDVVATQGLAGLGLPTSPSTAHVSVIDSDGTACAITASAGYGSGMTVTGTGLVLNNCLGEPELNRRGLHALAPGTRLASNMAPTIARHADGTVLAVGSPGADRITTALQQVLARAFLDGMPLADAIAHPRLHVKVVDGVAVSVDHEPDPAIAAAVAATGLPALVHPPLSMYFGGVGAARRGPDGELSAAADPRRESATTVG